MIFVIDDDMVMARCVADATGKRAKVFSNAIEAMDKIASGAMPSLIFLDILLDGPDGFTFLNELVTYSDTGRIPIVIISSLEIKEDGLFRYGVVGVLNKDTMRPEDIRRYVVRYAG